MKYINLSSLVRNANENSDIFSLAAKKAISLDFTINNTSGSINNFSTSEESSFKFTAATEITGFSGGTDGKILYLYNGNNSSQLTLKNNSSSSSSGNKILTNNGQDLIIQINGGAILQYDSDSLVWRTIGISNSHNDLILLQGGGSSNYYHSNQPINSTDNVSFNNLSVVSGVNVTGSVKLNNIIYPVSDGAANQVIKTDGSGNLSFGTITQDHSLLTNLQGGGGGNYYHSNQPINSTDNVAFNSINSSTLNVTGTSTLATTNMTTGNVSGELNVTGASTQNIINFTSGNISGALNVTGTSTLKNISASGTVVVNGLTYPSGDGTANQVLKTDGSGNISFATVSGGGSAGLTYQVTTTPLGTLKVGMPVYWNGTTYAPANANTNTKIPTAVVKEINVSDYTVQFGGTLTLTNTQWGQLTNVTGGLSTSSGSNIYFLSDVNDGEITNVSPIFSIPVLNCIKNDSTNSTVEIKFGTLSSTLTNESYSREREIFTGNGSNLTFTLTLTPHSRNTTMVSIDGVLQQSDSFSISNKNIVFSGSPPANSEIEVNYVTQKNLNYANIIKHVEVTSTSKTAFTLPVTPSSESEVMAWVGGSYQDNSNFTLSGNILTFDTIVDSGVKVQFVIFTSVQFTDFPFIKRKSIAISNNGTKTLIDVFGNQSTARYDFHVIANPLIGGTVRLQETNPINVRVETFSTDISSTASTSSKLNIYINGSGNLEFQNLLGSSITLMLERHQ